MDVLTVKVLSAPDIAKEFSAVIKTKKKRKYFFNIEFIIRFRR